MRRTALASALLTVAALAVPGVAAADGPEMCAVGQAPTSVPAWLFEGAQDRLFDAMPEAAPPPAGAATPAPGTTDVLWCASGFDSRCQPVRTDGDGFFSALAHALSAPALASRVAVPRPPVSRASRFETEGGPRDGAHVRVERPPRG